VAAQEPSDQIRDQVGLLVQSEVAGVEDTHLGARDVSAVRPSLLDLERRVVAAPDDLQRRLVLAEPVLPGRVTRDISAVVVEQVGLDVLLVTAQVSDTIEYSSGTRWRAELSVCGLIPAQNHQTSVVYQPSRRDD
jgi:hypothetical protein